MIQIEIEIATDSKIRNRNDTDGYRLRDRDIYRWKMSEIATREIDKST